MKERIAEYDELVAACQRLHYSKKKTMHDDVWYQLVEYPIQAAAAMNHKWCYAQLARHGAGDEYWLTADAAHRTIIDDTKQYNEVISDGKWCGMMNYHPRDLAVYDSVPRSKYEGMLEHEIYTIGRPLRWERKGAIPELGYSRQAVPLEVGKAVELTVGSADSVVLAFVPNHPVQSKQLRVKVTLDDAAPQTFNIATYGRSETWKRNVKRNLALCPLPLGRIEGRHMLRIEALDPYIILDEVYTLDSSCK